MAVPTADESSVPKRSYCRDSRGRFSRPERPSGAKRKAGKKDAKRRASSVDLTVGSEGRKLSPRLIDDRPDIVATLFAPLRKGKPVWLEVSDLRLPKKTRKYKTVLIVCPLSVLGHDIQGYFVAMPPYGAELVSATDIKATTFARLGLSFSLARALADALKKEI